MAVTCLSKTYFWSLAKLDSTRHPTQRGYNYGADIVSLSVVGIPDAAQDTLGYLLIEPMSSHNIDGGFENLLLLGEDSIGEQWRNLGRLG